MEIGIRGHTFQNRRRKQIEWVEQQIIRYGGYLEIGKKLGIRNFEVFVAKELGCSVLKAREYVQLIIQAASVKAKMIRLDKKKKRKRVDKRQ